jgi:hypothetical protein
MMLSFVVIQILVIVRIVMAARTLGDDDESDQRKNAVYRLKRIGVFLVLVDILAYVMYISLDDSDPEPALMVCTVLAGLYFLVCYVIIDPVVFTSGPGFWRAIFGPCNREGNGEPAPKKEKNVTPMVSNEAYGGVPDSGASYDEPAFKPEAQPGSVGYYSGVKEDEDDEPEKNNDEFEDAATMLQNANYVGSDDLTAVDPDGQMDEAPMYAEAKDAEPSPNDPGNANDEPAVMEDKPAGYIDVATGKSEDGVAGGYDTPVAVNEEE